jgi:hypothetical protein
VTGTALTINESAGSASVVINAVGNLDDVLLQGSASGSIVLNVLNNFPGNGTNGAAVISLQNFLSHFLFSEITGSGYLGTAWANGPVGEQAGIGTSGGQVPLVLVTNHIAAIVISGTTQAVAINAPSGGASLTVANNGNDSIVVASNHAAGAGLGFLDTNGSPHSYRIGLGIGDATTSLNVYDATAGAIRLSLNAAGNVSIAAPSSGAALAIGGVGGTTATLTTQPLLR